jgi:hypothetical protein
MAAVAFYTVHDLADRWQVSEKQIRVWIRKGALPATLLGARALRISLDAAHTFEQHVTATDTRPVRRTDSTQPSC